MAQMAFTVVVAFIATCAVVPDIARAADLEQEFAPYLWGAGLDGESAAGGVSGAVHASFGDILSNLDTGFMGTYRAHWSDWSATVDAIYIDLQGTARGPGGQLRTAVDADQTILEVDAGRDVTDGLTLLGGLRYVDLSAKIVTTGPLGNKLTARAGDHWVDPVVGALYSRPLSARWVLSLRADVGGFGVGSDFAWQAVASIRWQATPAIAVVGAYRHLAMDFESGTGRDHFRYDAAISGPATGVAFRF